MAGSIESVPSQFYVSLREAGIDNLLDFLSRKPESEVRFGQQQQQRGDPELSPVDKLILLRQKLDKNPGSFLTQFGRYLQPSHLDCFNSIRNENYEVDLYLKQMEVSTRARKTQIKNRRYEALRRLVDTTDYFTEEEMQRRNPILFNQLIGKYHTTQEREAFLFQSSKSSTSIFDPSSKPTPLTDMLIAHLNRHDGVCSDRRIEQQHQVQEEMQADKEYTRCSDRLDSDSKDPMKSLIEDESDCEDEEDEDMDKDEDEEVVPEIDETEKDLLKEEFFTTMYCHFLEGKDEDFEYTSVDSNPDYDCGENLDQDEEEKYFDAEEPQSSRLEDDSNIDIENVGQSDYDQHSPKVEVTVSNVNSELCVPSSSQIVTGDDEEDELDSYMKTIEMEIKRQSHY